MLLLTLPKGSTKAIQSLTNWITWGFEDCVRALKTRLPNK